MPSRLAALPPPLTGVRGPRTRRRTRSGGGGRCLLHSDNHHCFHPLSLSTCLPSSRRRRRTTQRSDKLLRPVGFARDRVMSVCSGVLQPIRPFASSSHGRPRLPKTSDRGPFSQAMDRCQGWSARVRLSRCLVSLVSKLSPRLYSTCRRSKHTPGPRCQGCTEAAASHGVVVSDTG